MTIERLTVQQLIQQLQQFPLELPVVVHSYEEGYDPVTAVETISVATVPNREWYVGVYDSTPDGERVLLIASKYYKSDIESS
jgi:hypothetical protein